MTIIISITITIIIIIIIISIVITIIIIIVIMRGRAVRAGGPPPGPTGVFTERLLGESQDRESIEVSI